MRKIKSKTAVIIAMVFVFTMILAPSAGAWTSVQKVDAYSGVKIFYNGQQIINPNQPFIINDTTYVPLRMIMELIGSGVTWDAVNYRVMLTGASTTVKDAEIAALKKQVAQLESTIAELEGGNLDDLDEIEENLSDYFADAGDEYFDDSRIKVSFSLSGDEDDLAYSIKLDFARSYEYDDLSDVSKSDIETLLDDIEEEIYDAIDNTDFEDADITGKLVDEDDSDLYVRYNGRSYTYNWGIQDLGDIEDEIINDFSNAGNTYFGDSAARITMNLNGDEDDLEYTVYIDLSYSHNYDDLSDIAEFDIERFLDDIEEAINDEIDGTDFEYADITGEFIDRNDYSLYVEVSNGDYDYSW